MSLATVHIVVPGAIVPWKRAQRRRFASGAHVTFTDPKVEAYHGVVRLAAAAAMAGRAPIDTPIILSVLAVFEPPKMSIKGRREALAGLRHKTTRPDMENTIKGALDAMQSVVYCDDAQIIGYEWCAKVFGDRPRLEIIARPIPHGQPFAMLFPSPFLANSPKQYAPVLRVAGAASDLFAEPAA